MVDRVAEFSKIKFKFFGSARPLKRSWVVNRVKKFRKFKVVIPVLASRRKSSWAALVGHFWKFSKELRKLEVFRSIMTFPCRVHAHVWVAIHARSFCGAHTDCAIAGIIYLSERAHGEFSSSRCVGVCGVARVAREFIWSENGVVRRFHMFRRENCQKYGWMVQFASSYPACGIELHLATILDCVTAMDLCRYRAKDL